MPEPEYKTLGELMAEDEAALEAKAKAAEAERARIEMIWRRIAGVDNTVQLVASPKEWLFWTTLLRTNG